MDHNGISYKTALHYRVCPVSNGTDEVHLVAAQEPGQKAQKDLAFIARKPVSFSMVTEEKLLQHLETVYSEEERKIEKLSLSNASAGVDTFAASTAHYSIGDEPQSPVVRMVNDLFLKAINAKASDIHLEPAASGIKARFRLDGVLHNVYSIPEESKAEVISRIKIMANLDIAEKRRPQDGKIIIETKQKAVDVRVSSMPTPHGEKIVLRILDKDAVNLDLNTLGLRGDKFTLFTEAINRPFGLILVTGPTGSGKTTTLYAALKAIHSSEINISTVEDPIEYQVTGINQTQMNEKIGYSFANAVRTFLRQDPDVILIGEIRDPETAKYAIQAAQTGHLVFSTLHTNDAPSAVTRLLEMGQEPYLVASTVSLVIAQRLLRVLCKSCKQERDLSEGEIIWLGDTVATDGSRTWQANSCEACNNTGYRGRIAVYEIMPVIPEIQRLITQKAPAQEIFVLAQKHGMVSLHQAGLELAKEGITSLEEVKREIG